MAETGTSVGEISGQSKSINSCDFRPARPFRLITGSEDNTIGVFEGPPFKFKYVRTKFYILSRVRILIHVIHYMLFTQNDEARAYPFRSNCTLFS